MRQNMRQSQNHTICTAQDVRNQYPALCKLSVSECSYALATLLDSKRPFTLAESELYAVAKEANTIIELAIGFHALGGMQSVYSALAVGHAMETNPALLFYHELLDYVSSRITNVNNDCYCMSYALLLFMKKHIPSFVC